MKRFYWITASVMIVVVLIVLFVPGAKESIEGRLLSWLAGVAS